MNKTLTLVFIFLLAITQAKAVKYTAINSGNFSSTSTWQNGNVPPNSINSRDTVQINKNVSVNLDIDLTLNLYSRLMLDSNANLSATNAHFIENINGYFVGKDCSISVDSIFQRGNFEYYEGDVTVNRITLRNSVRGKVNLTVKDILNLGPGGGYFDQCTLNLGSSKRITIVHSGGYIDTSNKILDLSQPFDIRYTDYTYDINKANELKTKGLRNIEIDIGTHIDAVWHVYKEDFVVKNKLILTSGLLAFDAVDLILDTNASIDHNNIGGIQFTWNVEKLIVRSTLNNIGNVPGAARIGGTSIGGLWLAGLEMQSSNPNATIYIDDGMTLIDHLTLNGGKVAPRNCSIELPWHSTEWRPRGGSKDSYVVTEHGGTLSLCPRDTLPLVYPIGLQNQYTPVTFTPVGRINSGYIQTSVSKGMYSIYNDPNSSDLAQTQATVDLVWDISSFSQAEYSDITFTWDSTSEVNNFSRNNIYVANNGSHAPNYWQIDTQTVATQYSNGRYQTTLKKTSIPYSNTRYALVNSNFVSVEELAQTKASTTLYPNPATKTLNISYSGHEKVNATIYDVTGRALKTVSIAHGKNSINVAKLSSGNYIIKLEGNGVNTTHKFVKQ